MHSVFHPTQAVPPTSGCRFRRTPARVAATRPQGAGAADMEGGGTNDA